MNDMGILPEFKGILCHDHWKPYYKIDCTHTLCNTHHLRELTRAFEQDGQKWAQDLSNLLVTINQNVIDAGAALDAATAQKNRLKYREIIKKVKLNALSLFCLAQEKGQKRPDQEIEIQEFTGASQGL